MMWFERNVIMFAHHVIKALSDPQNSMLWHYSTETKERLAQFIKVSTKYHMGNLLKNVYNVLHPMITKYEKDTGHKFKIFTTQMNKVVSPFAATWFEWFAEESPAMPKYASLVLKSDSPSNKKGDLLSIYVFLFNKPKNEWGLSPIMSSVDTVPCGITTGWLVPKELFDRLPKNNIQGFREVNQYGLTCVYLNLLFLNCRNIKTIIQSPSQKLQKKRRKKGKLPLFSYYALEIKDMRKKTTKPEGYIPTPSGIKQRYHQMPARIVYYSKEKPLFGNPKNVGWFAFKSYWKGDLKKGTILKDYEVKERRKL